ncbi:MAG: tRNA pseudouridine(38-40) synthase TruA [Flavobacteriales bacterium]|nr:MAG: tRNA pseudouridine(38-40) synthase TruA [Flavobacteriales bacterium]
MRYFLRLKFEGTFYSGWQIQPNAPTVQETLQSALSTILRTSTEVIGAGRTDAGVHATGMYAHFDSDEIDLDIKHKLNRILPQNIAIDDVYPVVSDAHARFTAINRSYLYRIHLHKNPFLEKRSYHHYSTLNVDAMNAAAKYLIGEKNFRSFEKSRAEENTGICTVMKAYWEEKGEGELHFHITANRFLRNMVRAITGTLLDVGMNKISPESMLEIIELQSRQKAGVSVPAHGLYLTNVEYPQEIYL